MKLVIWDMKFSILNVIFGMCNMGFGMHECDFLFGMWSQPTRPHGANMGPTWAVDGHGGLRGPWAGDGKYMGFTWVPHGLPI